MQFRKAGESGLRRFIFALGTQRTAQQVKDGRLAGIQISSPPEQLHRRSIMAQPQVSLSQVKINAPGAGIRGARPLEIRNAFRIPSTINQHSAKEVGRGAVLRVPGEREAKLLFCILITPQADAGLAELAVGAAERRVSAQYGTVLPDGFVEAAGTIVRPSKKEIRLSRCRARAEEFGKSGLRRFPLSAARAGDA